jgi:hypothetical protein
MYEFCDPKALTDEELFERIRKINQLISFEIQMGHNSMVRNMELTVAILLEEHEYRASLKAKTNEEEMKKQRGDKEVPRNLSFGKIEGEE